MTFAGAQTLAGLMQGNQRGGTGRVHHKGWPGKAKGVGQPPSRCAEREAGDHMHLIFGGEPLLMRHVDPIFKVAEANKDAGQAIKE